MFFIAGLNTRISTVDTGVFHCPNEGTDRRYDRQHARRWITLFFVPLIPLRKRGEWLQCRGCGVRYGPDAVRRHPAANPS